MTEIDAINLQQRLSAIHRRRRNYNLKLRAITVLVLASYLSLSALLIWQASPLAAMLFSGLLTAAALVIGLRRGFFKSPAMDETCRLLDEQLNTKDRVVSYVGLLNNDAAPSDPLQPEKKALLEKQLAPYLPKLRSRELLPLRMPAGLCRLCFSLPIIYLILAYAMVQFYGPAARGAINTNAQLINKLLQENPNLPPELKSDLGNLSDVLNQNEISSAEVSEALEQARRDLARAEAALETGQSLKDTETLNSDQGTEAPRPTPVPSMSLEPSQTPSPSPQAQTEQEQAKPAPSAAESTPTPPSSSESEQNKQEQQKKDSQSKSGQQSNQAQQGQSGQNQAESQQQKEQGKDGQGSGQQGNSPKKEGPQQGNNNQGAGQGSSSLQDQKEGKEGKGENAKSGQPKEGQSQGDTKKQEQGGQSGKDQQKSQEQKSLDNVQKTLDKLQNEMKKQESEQQSKPGEGKKGGESQQSAKADAPPEAKQGEKGAQAKENTGEQQKPGANREKKPTAGGSGNKAEQPEQKRDEKKGESGHAPSASKAEGLLGKEPEKKPSGLGGEKGYQDVDIPKGEEQFDKRFTDKQTNLRKGSRESGYRVELKDLQAAKPDAVKGKGEQPIPLEYRDLME